MRTLLNKILQEKGDQLNHHLLIWATDALIYKKVYLETDPITDKHLLKFRLFNETEEYYGYTRQGKVLVRHLSDITSTQPYLEKKVKLKGNIAQQIDPKTEKDLLLTSRDYLAFKPNGQAYYHDSRMVTIDQSKLITHE